MIGHIFKYPIPLTDELIEIEMPENCAICDIHYQGDNIFIWALIDVHAPLVKHKFRIFGTGHKIDNVEDMYFLKTIHMFNGLVWHLFGVRETKSE